MDSNVRDVCDKLIARSVKGKAKYGVTTERTDLDLRQWLQHLQEELMDGAVYIQRIMQETNK